MTSNYFLIQFSEISKDIDLRNDEKYHDFLHFYDWNLFQVGNKKVVPLSEILVEDIHILNYQESKEYKGIPTGQTYIDEDGEIINFQPVSLNNHPDRIRYQINENNILISSLRLAKSPALLLEREDLLDYVFSNGYYSFMVKKGWNKKFVLYLLRTKKIKKILDNHIYRGIGISSYKKDDLLKIKIPFVDEVVQNQIVDNIEQIEKRILLLKSLIKQPQEIIDSVFAEEFDLNINSFENLKKTREFNIPFTFFSNNRDLRNSVSFHQDSAYYVMKELKKISASRIKDFIEIPIELGATITPLDFNESGEYYYISMESVKNYSIEIDDSQLISAEYVKKNINKSVKKFDIIMTRSGVAIGKFALIEKDIKGIFSDFTMRIRLINYNPYFAYYYFRTSYFQHLIHTNKKGLQNKNIFPIQIKEFPIINIPIEEQKRIADKIKNNLDNQERIRTKIFNERAKIETLVENSLIS